VVLSDNTTAATGVVSYVGKSQSKAMFTTHPLEKPYLIYQIGSADPDLAVQAAKVVMQDVAGIDLNCGCPKPFSTHAGMGAALLSTPDLLCSILTALRAAMPPEISVSAKIRLLPSQEDTLKLVERIVNTGITTLTVHCRTRNMRPRERALIERMKEIVEFVEAMGKGVAVIENGDCLGYEDSKRIRKLTSGFKLDYFSNRSLNTHRRTFNHDCHCSRGKPYLLFKKAPNRFRIYIRAFIYTSGQYSSL
jgi:tRNA-dihydrouridine synthase 2